MSFMAKEDSTDAICDYLQKIYQLQVLMAKTNTPLICAASGNVQNSGATLLAASGIPLIT